VLRNISLSVLLVLVLAAPVRAADFEGRFAVRDVGSLTCGQVTRGIVESSDQELQRFVAQLTSWLGGYLTRANRQTDGVFDIVPIAADRDVLTVAVNRCAAFPEGTNFEAAVASVVAILQPLAVDEASPVESLTGSIALRRSVLLEVNRRLVALGFFEEEGDEPFGSAARVAIRAFREASGMPLSGELDVDTLLLILGRE